MSARTLLTKIATLSVIGYLPVAPGTWGSAAGVLFVVLTRPSSPVLTAIIVVMAVTGVFTADAAEKEIGEADSGHIVIDEFVGYVVSVAFVPQTLGYLAAAFLLFRFFDILKPFPIGMVEKKLSGGLGVMADDIVAGLFANLVLQLWKMIF